MFERTFPPLITLTLLKLVADFIPPTTFLASATTRGAFVLLGDAIPVLPETFSVNEVLHRLVEEDARLLM